MKNAAKISLALIGVVIILLCSVVIHTKTKNQSVQSPVKSTEENTASQQKQPVLNHYDFTSLTSLQLLVNKMTPLSDAQYRPTDLVVDPVRSNTDKTDDERSIRAVVASDLQKMFADAKVNGFDVMMASGFRSYQLQQSYFSSYSAAYGVAEAEKFSAHPGQSEHQTGLALDISYTNRNCYLDVCFGDTPAGQWLAAHAYEYGFVLRYPADKTAITGYQYEPWHFRYVGHALAKELHDSGKTLEEYVGK